MCEFSLFFAVRRGPSGLGTADIRLIAQGFDYNHGLYLVNLRQSLTRLPLAAKRGEASCFIFVIRPQLHVSRAAASHTLSLSHSSVHARHSTSIRTRHHTIITHSPQHNSPLRQSASPPSSSSGSRSSAAHPSRSPASAAHRRTRCHSACPCYQGYCRSSHPTRMNPFGLTRAPCSSAAAAPAAPSCAHCSAHSILHSRGLSPIRAAAALSNPQSSIVSARLPPPVLTAFAPFAAISDPSLAASEREREWGGES